MVENGDNQPEGNTGTNKLGNGPAPPGGSMAPPPPAPPVFSGASSSANDQGKGQVGSNFVKPNEVPKPPEMGPKTSQHSPEPSHGVPRSLIPDDIPSQQDMIGNSSQEESGTGDAVLDQEVSSEGGMSFRKIKDRFTNMFKGSRKEPLITKKALIRKDEDEKIQGTLELMEILELNKDVKVHIFLDSETSEYIYNPVEPKLAPRQKEVLDFILETLNKVLSYNQFAMEDLVEKERFLKEEVDSILSDYSSVIGTINEEFMEPIIYYIRREYIGYGKIQSIMMDPGVEDVSCDGTAIPVFVYHRDFGSIRTTIEFEDDESLEGFVVSLSQRAGKSITVANPILDATLPEGHRLNATFGREVTTRGSSFTIRKFKEDPLTITDLVKFGTLSSEMAAHFWLAVQYGDSMIFAGGTASGKTATMNAISIFIPTSAKIISIEDTREVNLPHQNWIAGITRGSAEGGKDTDIDMYALLRAALRQRPEYVLVGEVRGKETMTMFQAMSTGHTTYSTMHADSVKSIVYRLENPPISIPRVLIQSLNLVAIHNQIRVKGMRVRRITELVEVVGIEPTSLEIITNRVYKWEPAGDHFVFGGHSNLYEKVMDFEDMTRDEVVTELNRRAEIIDWMIRNKVREYRDVNTIVAEYYEDSEKVIRLLRENRDIDISRGLDFFQHAITEKLPESNIESLPSAKDIVQNEQAGGV